MNALETENLVKIFHGASEDVKAVNGVSLYLADSEFVALMGPSGTGKTTLLSMLGCILAPDAGTLRVCGEEVVWKESILPEYRRRFYGFVAQRSVLLSSLNVRENVTVPLVLAGMSRNRIEARCDEVLSTANLLHRADYPVSVLSGGERQRAAVARAIAADPPILLCDEPTASLDSKTGHQIISTLKKLTTLHGKSVLMVTHDERYLPYADRVYYMSDGRVEEKKPDSWTPSQNP